jgi:DNA-binding SARP family transcriptional activator
LEEHKSTYPLIHNKITAPHYVTPTLRRGRLVDWLHERAGCRALVLAAEAGYGKTTLLWQWEREVDFPCYWYKLDRNDRDWTLHISYIVEAVSQRHPGFGRRAHSVLRQMGGPGSSRPGVTAFLLAEMHERLTEPCTFIIDDWQYVASVTEVRGLWNQILRDAPPTCRFVFASRGKPQLQFARFKTHSGYGELRTDDLRLTESEIAELFRDVYRDPLTSDEVSELERRTEGWAASLQLIEVSLRDKTTADERRALIESIADSKESDLFEFLAQEVLDQQSDETRNFLLVTSILQQITPDLAERMAGVHEGARHLLQLEHTGLFTYRLDETRYRYHGLFREFLERRLLDERSETEVTGLHIHAASYYETGEQWPLAIYHYLKANLKRQAARLIARYGEEVIAEGRLGLVDEWLNRLPDKAIQDNARLSLLHGEVLGIRGEYSVAISVLDRAREFFMRKHDQRMEALALLKESSVNNLWGKLAVAADLARRGLELAPSDDGTLRLRLEGNLLVTDRWLSERLPDLVDPLNRLVTEASRRGLEHYSAIGMHNLGVLLRDIGDLRGSLSALERAARYWHQIPDSPFGDNYELVSTLLALDDAKSARVQADRGMATTKPWPRSHGEATCGLAAVQLFEGKFAAAEQSLRPTLARADLGSTYEQAASIAIEAAVLGSCSADILRPLADGLRQRHRDARMIPVTGPSVALAEHALGRCGETCGDSERTMLRSWRARGAESLAVSGLLKLGSLALDHRIVQQQASRLFIRGFGQLVVHRGGWEARGIGVPKRRLRLLLSLLVAHAGEQLPREVVLDTLWPDSNPRAAVNSLNQSIFQLRRLLDPEYRDGVSPPYVVSTIESVSLNQDLIRTDLDEFRRRVRGLANPLNGPAKGADALEMMRGEYLADARYAEWAEPIRGRVHAEVRAALVPMLRGADRIALRAADILIELDPFDETAHVARWHALAGAGRREAARRASAAFIKRYRDELAAEPSAETLEAASSLRTNRM